MSIRNIGPVEPKHITHARAYANDLFHGGVCKYGHFDCASRDGGRCSNEVAVNVCAYEDKHGLPRTTIPEDEKETT